MRVDLREADTVSRDWKSAKTWLYQELCGARRLPR
jgi:hypothetical protein